MRHQTYKRMQKAWLKMPKTHIFENRGHFFATAEKLGEVSGDGRYWFYSLQRSGDPFGPENIKLVHVQTPDDWDRVLYPAI